MKRLILALAVAATAIFVIGGGVASAHHPVLSGAANCDVANNQWTVTWTVQADAARGLTWSVNGAGSKSDSQSFVFTTSHGLGDATANFTANASWSNGVTSTRSASVNRPEGCQPPESTTTTTLAPTTTTLPPTTTTLPPTTTSSTTTTTQPPTTTTLPPTTTIAVAKLQLTYIMDCVPDAMNTWRVRNTNAFDVTYTWNTAQGGSGGPLVAPPGDSFFETPRGTETMRIYVDGVLNNTKTSGNDVDPSDPKCTAVTTTTEPEESTTTTSSTTTTEPEVTTTEPEVTTTEPAPTTTQPAAPTFDIAALAPVCMRDAPFIQITFGDSPELDGRTATVTYTDVDGNVVGTDTTTFQSGATAMFVYPGATVDAQGNATDWPGWLFDGDEWVPDPSDGRLRDGLTVAVEVDPTASAQVTYPPATSACASPPSASGVGGVVPSGALPATGSSNAAIAAVGLTLLGLGAAAVRFARPQS